MLPHDAVAEQSVIGSILLHAPIFGEVLELLRADDFYVEANRNIFAAMQTLYQSGANVDHVTVQDAMSKAGTSKTNTHDYIYQIVDLTPTWRNWRQYALIVQDKSRLRAIAEAAASISQAIADGTADSAAMLEFAEHSIYGLRGEEYRANNLMHVGDALMSFVDRSKSNAERGDFVTGFQSGFGDLDGAIDGFGRERMVVIGARPGVGKTALAIQMSLAIAFKGMIDTPDAPLGVVYYTLEMDAADIAGRMLSSATGIDGRNLQRGRLNEGEWQHVGGKVSELSRLNFWVNRNHDVTIDTIRSQCRRIANLGVVVVDYLQLMNTLNRTPGTPRAVEVGELSRSLKQLSMDLNVCVICLAQLNRDVDRRGDKVKIPRLSDLRESGSIEQDADIVLLLYEDEDYDKRADETVTVVKIAKNRYGLLGEHRLMFCKPLTLFTELGNE